MSIWNGDGSRATLEGSLMVVHRDGSPMRGDLFAIATRDRTPDPGWWVSERSSRRHRPTCGNVVHSSLRHRELSAAELAQYEPGQCCAPGLTDHQPGQPSD